MTADAKHIIDDFGALPDPALSDNELVSTANDVFLEYDRRESDV